MLVATNQFGLNLIITGFTFLGFNTSKPRYEPVRVHFAINKGDLVAVQRYIEAGYDLNYVIHGNTPLTLAILKDQFEIVHMLLDGDCDVNIPENTKWKRMPIHLAACVGDVDIITKIIDKGCPVDVRDMTDLTALHWASMHGHDEAVEYLLQRGRCILSHAKGVGPQKGQSLRET